MLYRLYIYSKSRKKWFFLTCSALFLELITLSLQYFFLLKPCILCIYQRCALFGIAISGLIAIIAPSYAPIRLLSIFTWIYSAWKGFILAKTHVNIQLHPSPFSTCDLFIKFPDWLPLNKWFPIIFNSYGDCSGYSWYFLSLEISQWMLIIFFNYLTLSILICFSQFIKLKK